MSGSEVPRPQIPLLEHEQKLYVQPFPQNPRFRVGDKVYLVKNSLHEGPYLVASILSIWKCILSREDGAEAEDGIEIDVEDLRSA